MKKNIFKVLIPLAIGIIVIITVTIFKIKGIKDANAEVMKDMNFSFTGIVDEKSMISQNTGILHLVRFNSEMKFFDKREDRLEYIIVVDSNKAELIVGAKSIETGDSVSYNPQENILQVFDLVGALKDEKKLGVLGRVEKTYSKARELSKL